MIKSSLFTIIVLFYTSSFSQTFIIENIKSFLDHPIYLIRSNAVDTSNIQLIESTLYGKGNDLNSLYDLAPLHSEVFELLNDHHGGLKYNGKTYGWNKPARSFNAYLKGKLKAENAVVR